MFGICFYQLLDEASLLTIGGLLIVGAGAIYDSFTDSWDFPPHTGYPCPCLIHGRYLAFLQLDVPCFVDTHGRPGLSETEGDLMGWEQKGEVEALKGGE